MILEPMLVRSSIRGNAAAAKSRGLSQVERRYVVGSVLRDGDVHVGSKAAYRDGPPSETTRHWTCFTDSTNLP
jgi:hypothetical protein